MDKEEAISLLLKSAGIKDKSTEIMDSASRIVSELGFIPLAIDQAGAYMQGSHCDLDVYLDLYHKQCRELMLNSLFKGASNYGKSTYGTWEISMKELESRATRGSGQEKLAAQSAIILFKYFAFLHHDNISEDIFRTAAENYCKRDIKQEKSLGLPLLVDLLDPKALFLDVEGQWDSLTFHDSIRLLLSFSIIKGSNKMYSIHPLMHAWSRDRINRADVSATYYMAVALLSSAIQANLYDDNYLFCMEVVPHIRASQKYASDLKLEVINFDDECQSFASAFHRTGNLTEAQQWYQYSMEVRTTKLGAQHQETLFSLLYLAEIYRRQELLEKAEKLQLQALKGWKSSFGSGDIKTFDIMHDLALVYWKQGRLEEAENLELEVLDKMKEQVGAGNPNSCRIMHGLAVVYHDQGRLMEAEKLHLQALEGMRAGLGVNHPHTLAIMNDLAVVYKAQGRLKEAEQTQFQILEGRKAKLGVDHPSTLDIVHHLALTYQKQGMLDYHTFRHYEDI